MSALDAARLVVLVSGNGSNLQAIMDACADGRLPAQVIAVISDRPEAFALQRARGAGIPAYVLPKAAGLDRRTYDLALSDLVARFEPDWVILAGWMRLLTCVFLERFPNHVINLHPALPGQFAGTHAIERAYAAYRAGTLTHTGVMVHLVPDEGVDSGPVLGQATVPIRPDDTLAALEARVHAAEHQLLVATLARLLAEPANERGSSP